MKVYVDWYHHRILSEEELQDKITEQAQKLRKNRDTMSDFVVDKNYEADLLEIILDRREADMESIEKEYEEWCLGYAEDAIFEDFEGYDIDD